MSAFWTDTRVRAALGLDADPASGAGASGTQEGAAADTVEYTAVATDTRTLEPGSLFVALRGENFDGHAFLADAVARGARGAVVREIPEDAPAELIYYRVLDTLDALGRLANYRRRRLRAKVCAITGTNGKTTTKEMARAVLATRYRVHATEANLNNLVGTPLTLLSAPDDVEAVVVEVGTNAPGEIPRLARIVEPDVALITGIGEGHLEGLGDLEGVLREKLALLTGMQEETGLALVLEEPTVLAERARSSGRQVRVAGWTGLADPELRAEGVRLNGAGQVHFLWAGREVHLRFRGRHHARNALLALGLGREWGVDADDAVAALAELEPVSMRGEFREIGDLQVVVDCYNANPASLIAALDLLVSMPRRGGRVAVVGSMLELGPASAALHRRAAETLARAELDLIVATGEFASAFEGLSERLGERLIREEEPLAAYEALSRRLAGSEVVLLKGSRGVALERLVPLLERDWSDPGGRSEDAAARPRDGVGSSVTGG